MDIFQWFSHLNFQSRLCLGLALIAMGQTWLLFAASKAGVQWPRWMMLVPGISVCFVSLYPNQGFAPCLVQLIGLAVLVSAFFSPALGH